MKYQPLNLCRLNLNHSLKDVEILLQFHDAETQGNSGRPRRELEVLKRAGIVLAVTAWEAFIEDTLYTRFLDRLEKTISPVDMSSTFNSVADTWLNSSEARRLAPPDLLKWTGDGWKDLIKQKLEDDIANFNTPNSTNLRKLFKRYLGVDITKGWKWQRVSPEQACQKLDDMIELRGELVHRAKELFEVKDKVRRRDVVDAVDLVKRLAQRTEHFLQSFITE